MAIFTSTSRRRFIAGGMCAACGSLAPYAVADTAKGQAFRLGVLSDIHLTKAGTSGHERLRLALAYLDARGVDAVVIAGDLANTSQVDELRLVAQTWNEAFPNGRGCDGRTVERILVTGNHDMLEGLWFRDEAARAKCATGSFSNDPARYWKEIFGEEWRPVSVRRIAGHDFVCVHYGHEAEVEAWFAENGSRLKGEKPFFFVQHLHPKGTCFQDGALCDKGVSTRVLSAYPNCFAITGHSHRPLAEERAIWQGAFTSMGASTTAGLLWPTGCENSYVPIAMRKKIAPQHMPTLSPRGSFQGAILTVTDSSIDIERRDFSRGSKVGPDWHLPLPLETHPDRPFIFAEGAEAPYYPERWDNKASVTERDGKDRYGKPERQLVVSAPPAWASTPASRTVFYLATAEDAETGKVLLTRKVLAEGYFLPFEEARRFPAKIVFAHDEFKPGTKVRFRVWAENSGHARGDPAVSNAIEVGPAGKMEATA